METGSRIDVDNDNNVNFFLEYFILRSNNCHLIHISKKIS